MRNQDDAGTAETSQTGPECPAWIEELNPYAAPYLDDPAPFHARLREEAPVCFSPTFGMWLVSRYEDINAVLKAPLLFSSADTVRSGTEPTPEACAILAQGYPYMATPFDSDPPLHTRLRHLMAKGFTPARVAAQAPHIRRIAHQLIDRFIAAGAADIIQELTDPLPVLVIIEMAGFPVEDMERIKRWGDDLFLFFFTKVPPERQVEVARTIVAFQRYCADFIEERRRAPREDLISDIMNAAWNGEALTMPELVHLVSGALLSAAHETTTYMLSKCIRLLLSERSRWEALRRDRALIPLALEESMRFDSTTHGMVRTVTRDVELSGVKLSKGERLLLLYSSANRDARRFADPDRFDLHRDNLHHLTFGRGIHYCIGAGLARLEGQIAIEALLDRLPDLRLRPGQRFEHTLNLALHGLKRLEVQWDPEGSGVSSMDEERRP